MRTFRRRHYRRKQKFDRRFRQRQTQMGAVRIPSFWFDFRCAGRQTCRYFREKKFVGGRAQIFFTADGNEKFYRHSNRRQTLQNLAAVRRERNFVERFWFRRKLHCRAVQHRQRHCGRKIFRRAPDYSSRRSRNSKHGQNGLRLRRSERGFQFTRQNRSTCRAVRGNFKLRRPWSDWQNAHNRRSRRERAGENLSCAQSRRAGISATRRLVESRYRCVRRHWQCSFRRVVRQSYRRGKCFAGQHAEPI